MASYRKPRGTVVRHLPDWNIYNMLAVSVIGTEFATDVSECGLANTDTQGRYCVVWDCSISHTVTSGNDPAVLVAAIQLYQTAGIPNTLQPIRLYPLGAPDVGVPTFNATSPGIQPNNPVLQFFHGAVNWEWPHEWPMCVIPAGWMLSCVFTGTTGGAELFAFNCTYEVTQAL